MERRKQARGLWVHWIGDLVSLVVVLIGLAISYGKLDQRVTNVENAQTEAKHDADRARTELKTDMQREFGSLADAVRALDTKLTAILLQRK